MSISVLNTDAGLSGKTIANLEDAQNVTGLKSFNRSPNPPFAVQAASAVVPNLIAESLSGGSVSGTSGVFSTTLVVTGLITGRVESPYSNTEVGSKNNWTPTGAVAGSNFITWSGVTDLTVTGFAGAAITATIGQTLTFFNAGGGGIAYFAHQSGSSTAANTFFNTVTSCSTPVAAGGHIKFIHNGAVWVMVEHVQGAFVTISHSDANFLGDATDGNWVVAVGDFGGQGYIIEGRTAVIYCRVITSTVANTPAVLRVAGWPFTLPTTSVYAPASYVSDNGTLREAYITNGNSTYVTVTLTTGAAWANATDATYVYFTCKLPIT